MKANSLAFRLVAGAGMWIAAAIIAGGVALSAIFSDYVERSFDARLMTLLDGLIAVSWVNEKGQLVVTRRLGDPRFARPYSGWYWQISGSQGLLLRSRSLWDGTLSPNHESVASGDKESGFQTLGLPPQQLRVVMRDISLPRMNQIVRFVVTGDAAEVEKEISHFNTILAWSLGVLGFGLIVAVLIQVRFGLQPLRRIRAALSSVRNGKATRLEGRFPAEIEPLASEINSLLDHNAEVLERTRTHVGNLAHALKTPLTVLTNESTASKSPLARTVQKQITAMSRHIDRYLSRARTAAAAGVLGMRTEVLPVAEDMCRTLKRIHAGRVIEIEVDGDPSIGFRGERHDLEEMLGNLIDNACKWARARIWLGVACDGPNVRISIEDDGPGLDAEQREEVFARGKRLDEATPGSGLGLSIVRDCAGLYGGQVRLEDSPAGGLRVVLVLPAASPAAGDEKV